MFPSRDSHGLLQLKDRVYVFGTHLLSEASPEKSYEAHVREVVTELRNRLPGYLFLGMNFQDGNGGNSSELAGVLSKHHIPVLHYEKEYYGCPILPVSTVHGFLRTFQSWLSNRQHAILLHCEKGGWPLLAFILSILLISEKDLSDPLSTLKMAYNAGPKGLSQLLLPKNPFPSQLRYIQYVTSGTMDTERCLFLDRVHLRGVPVFDSRNGCRPMFRIFGTNLQSTRSLQHYSKAACDEITVDIQCLVQGDVVLECVHLDLDPPREVPMFRVVFNTAFIQNYSLFLKSEMLDILCDSKKQFPNGFRVEVYFGEVDRRIPPRAPSPTTTTSLNGEEIDGSPNAQRGEDEEAQAMTNVSNASEIASSSQSTLLSPPRPPPPKLVPTLPPTPPSSSIPPSPPTLPPSSGPIRPLPPTSASVGPPPPPRPPSFVRPSPPPLSGLTQIGSARPAGTANVPNKLKPLYWGKITQATEGSLWSSFQEPDNISGYAEIDISDLPTLFSVAPTSDGSSTEGGGDQHKPKAIELIDARKAQNVEIMLSKIKMSWPELFRAILALDSSVLDIVVVDNLIKYFPTEEEMEMLKNYTGDKDMLRNCEKFLMEVIHVPRLDSKLRVLAIKFTFSETVSHLAANLNLINDAVKEVKGSMKLLGIMKVILKLGNALNEGTTRGSAKGFKLDTLNKLSELKVKQTSLMHYLCKILADQLPQVLDFDKDLVHLEASSKIQLKELANDIQGLKKDSELVELELNASENDEAFKDFPDLTVAVSSLNSLYGDMKRSADSLVLFFGENPATFPFEQVLGILVEFVKKFKLSMEHNKKADAEKKKLAKEKP